MKLKKITNKIYLVVFPTSSSMCNTVVRFSEYYENPHFKGTMFSLKEFKQWYKKFTNSKRYTYASDWDGFNLNGDELLVFRHSNKLRKCEQEFLDLFKHIPDRQFEKICVIAMSKNSDRTTYKHELAHALYKTNKQYKKDIDFLLKGFPGKKKIFNWLKKTGYHKSVWQDEMHAYLIEHAVYVLIKNNIKITDYVLTIVNLLYIVYEKYKP